MLWHPIETPKCIVNGFGGLISTLKNEGLEEAVAEVMPELYQLATQWDKISDETKCYLMGRAVGEYGAGIASGAGIAKLVSRLKSVKKAGLLSTEFSRNVLKYFRAIEQNTGFRIGSAQRARLAANLRITRYTRLSPQEGGLAGDN